MKSFMDENFLLKTKTAQDLYHNYAANKKIVDYHCHINPEEIAKDKKFDNITKIWLGGDHYKWRLMRAAGVTEEYITGNAPDYDKFVKWAETLSMAVGNPLYHWSHLELKNYFGYNGTLSGDTAAEVWDICNKKLATDEMSAKNIIKNSNVEIICTTDDPVDSLQWHEEIAKDESFGVKVYPAWRPDKALNIEKNIFPEYLGQLADVTGILINNYSDLKAALVKRMGFFNEHGCKTSDHGLLYVAYTPATEDEIEKIFEKRKKGGELTALEVQKYKSAFMVFSGQVYEKLGWVMQLHFCCKRDNNTKMFNLLGPDTGYDCINNYSPSSEMADFLNALEINSALPKTILYSLNPVDNAYIDTIAGCFQGGGIKTKIQHGSAWWFNDNKRGMYEHMETLASLGYLAGFVGMLTDSRSFLSYPRHEYFRRILCDFLGKLVEDGEYPQDYNLLSKIVSDISYNNAKSYFGF